MFPAIYLWLLMGVAFAMGVHSRCHDVVWYEYPALTIAGPALIAITTGEGKPLACKIYEEHR